MISNRSMWMAALVAAAMAAPMSDADAQWNAARYDSTQTWVYGSYGVDPGVVGTIGLARSFAALGGSQLSAEAGWDVAGLDIQDFRGRLSAKTSAVRWRSMRLVAEAAMSGRGTSNSVYRAVGVGVAGNLTAGVYRRRWFAGAEGGYDRNAATRITHSAWYRTYFYPDAKDGWYGPSGGTIHYGLTGGVTVGKTDLMMRGGLLRTERFGDMTPPFYMNVGVGYRLQ
jgi:hypothetical protein